MIHGGLAFVLVCLCLFGMAISIAHKLWPLAIICGALLWIVGETCYWKSLAEWWGGDDDAEA